MPLFGPGAPGHALLGPLLRLFVGQLDLVVAFEAPRARHQARLIRMVGHIEEGPRVPPVMLEGRLRGHDASLGRTRR